MVEPTWAEIGNFGSLKSRAAPGEPRSSELRFANFLCRMTRKYIRIVMRVEAMILPTIASAAWVAVTAAFCDAVTC
jgi:hypothetical protein